MEKAKAAVTEFVGRHGKHDTIVDERQAPAVKHEEAHPVRHENITTAVDREVDQDHFHTTVQPIKDREVLPEKHSHQMAGVQHKEFEHAKPQEIKARLDREAAQFKDTSTTHSTKHTQAVAPTVEGERVHHHVHETIQPVIEKEVIAPSVVHTTVPIHEIHHAGPEYHGTSVLPTKTVADFKTTGQSLTGSTGTTNQDQYEGSPRPYNAEMQVGRTDTDGNPHLHTSGFGSSNAGPHNSNMMNKTDPRVDSDRDGRALGGSHATAGPYNSDLMNKADPRMDSNRDGRGMGTGTTGNHNTGSKLDPRVDSSHTGAAPHTGHHERVIGGTGNGSVPSDNSSVGHKKPSLMDRLDPRKDADRDGRPGFMK